MEGQAMIGSRIRVCPCEIKEMQDKGYEYTILALTEPDQSDGIIIQDLHCTKVQIQMLGEMIRSELRIKNKEK